MPNDASGEFNPLSSNVPDSPSDTESLTNRVSISIQSLLDTLKRIGEMHESHPDYVWIELYRDGSWNLKVDGRFNDDIEEKVITGNSILEDFTPSIEAWMKEPSNE